MAESMLREEVEVYSEKYDIHGVVRDYGMVTKLFFTYQGKDIVMGVHRNILKGEKYEDLGRNIIDSYVTNLATHEEGKKLQLHYWYIEEHESDSEMLRIGHGIVTGHNKLSDAMNMHTSAVEAIHIDEEEGELVLTTRNSVYHCPLAYCRFKKQDKYPDIIPGYERLKEKYIDKIEYPSIDPGKVLLVLANFCDYYFHSLYYVPNDSKDGKCLEYSGWSHVGNFQDSYLINTEDYKVDLRYFPHYQNIEFYSEDTDGCPWFIENIGDVVIYAKTSAGTIKLEPGDRKEVAKENAEDENPILPDGDLYPAGIVE
ncbi:hypothetical protein SAMN02910400_00599 [Lachnospiraceae bacterium C10]|nr:hypothetical protein [Lachnospiraceae bacterium]SCW39307.1 hypothetical protein SAMN02910400_00599 [Lachnospiraceae bacterium C10]